ncbi:argininosuccinate synthase [Halanaeroarchaeum sulfurireducens]|uniref:Argininosuccinate synthase n=1 Tax=Halanaeroarchaeum sulfurireducens TaxID=1604004 RepID=A0A0F7PEF3_9EURY|nr:argininosuccinate synthase [Halanaeroarchaeum sulfurireducens]AKH98595.1 argininosuccinate synthase [Halanaeroarchaeum sulfurireducens]ALG83037.1 argininosuccinate synthase [Halanaeroarchaeum sulfurireducens]
MSQETVALAFSGGLDTTVSVPLLKEEYGYDEVIGVTVDVGQPQAEFDEATETAEAHDIEHYLVDATEEFADVCFDAVKANATYQGYPLGTALARPVIAQKILDVAIEHGASAVAHGATGKGNDQLRFEAVWRQSDLEVIAPIRELGLTREWEIEYANEKGLPVDAGNDGEWSIDSNLWSRSIEGGDLEDPAHVPTQDIYDWTDAPTGETATVEIAFAEGVPIGLDGEPMEPVELIETLNDLAGQYGVGRTDLMEDRMLGLKVRENYEHPAATTLLAAHEALEGLVLTKDERQFKTQIDQQWAEKAYEGLLSVPFVSALEGFIAETQTAVTGTVTVKFEGGQARPVARESEHSVYSESAASFDTEGVLGDITQSDATGVAKYHGFQGRLANTSGETGTDTHELTADGGNDEE